VKPAASTVWAIVSGVVAVVAGVTVIIALGQDPAPLLQLANLAATVGVGVWTAQLNGKIDRVERNTNGTNDRLLNMVAQTHPGISTTAPRAATDHPAVTQPE
jgi:hypothetical protein